MQFGQGGISCENFCTKRRYKSRIEQITFSYLKRHNTSFSNKTDTTFSILRLHRISKSNTNLHKLAQTCTKLQSDTKACMYLKRYFKSTTKKLEKLHRLLQTCTNLKRLAQSRRDLQISQNDLQITFWGMAQDLVMFR